MLFSDKIKIGGLEFSFRDMGVRIFWGRGLRSSSAPSSVSWRHIFRGIYRAP